MNRFYIINEKTNELVADMDSIQLAIDFVDTFADPDLHIYDDSDYRKFLEAKK